MFRSFALWLLCGLLAPVSVFTSTVSGQTTTGPQAAKPAFVTVADRRNATSVLEMPVSLGVHNVSVAEALHELSQRSGVVLAFSPGDISKHGPAVTCECATATVREALDEILGFTPFSYLAFLGEIIIYADPRSQVQLGLIDSDRDWKASTYRPLEPIRPGIGIVGTEMAQPPFIAIKGRQEGTIAGQIIEAGTLRPLPGAQIHIPGTGLGTLTNTNGRYRLGNIPAGEVTVRVQMIGFRTEERTIGISSGQSVQVDFELVEQALELDEVVVTGTAGRQLRRSQPAQVDVIRARDIVGSAPVTDMRDLLQSRSPGVSILGGGGSPGSGQRIRIRGPVSIDLSSQPLVFIDGVRINARLETSSRMEAGDGSGSGSNTGGAVTSRLNDIAPEDIENIEIVKGPAAATLYGADASAGVINIITKRGQQGDFRQTLNLEYNAVDANFTPPDNWARCTEDVIAAGTPICQGKAPGTLVSDNPLVREDVIRTGHQQRLSWSGQGGTAEYQYFTSLTYNKETGVLPGEEDNRWTGRLSFSWQPHPTLSLRAGYGVTYGSNRMIDNGNSLYGLFVNAFLGDPLTLGGPNNGWLALRRAEHIAALNNSVHIVRNMPTLEFNFEPYTWFTHRLILGGDFSNSETLKLTPRNDQNLYAATDNAGWVRETRRNVRYLTVDYLSNLRAEFGSSDQWGLSLALGSQVVLQRTDLLFGDGLGLVTNSARAISAAAERSAGQWFAEDRSIGYISQLEISHRDRLYLQVGMRADQNSSFGEDVPIVYLPKVGMSYVVSETPFWQERFPSINMLRLRAAFGTTGRAPRAGTSLRTFDAATYIGIDEALEVGMTLRNPGNPDLKPERGTEFEVGADIAFFDGRIALDVTAFNQTTLDAILPQLLPPSVGFTEDPLVNVGKIRNRGIEGRIRGGLIRRPGFSWDVQLGFSALDNELLDLGGIPPALGSERFQEGFPLAARFAHTLRGFDLDTGVAIMSDTMEFIGTQFPRYEGMLSTTMTIGSNLSLYALVDGKGGYVIDNAVAEYRDVSTPRSRGVVAPETLPPEGRLQRFGPFVTESGEPLPPSLGRAQYHFERGDHIRFREISATYTFPAGWAGLMRADRASLTLAARNLWLWTDYRGFDPDVQRLSSPGLEQWNSAEFFMLPPGRRLAVTLSLGF